MAVAGRIVLGILLAVSANTANAFMSSSLARIGALRQFDSKISLIEGLPPATAPVPQLSRSSFTLPLRAVVSGSSQQANRGALSMKVISVGVIGAGRWAEMPYFLRRNVLICIFIDGRLMFFC